jgi:hypothetical protein
MANPAKYPHWMQARIKKPYSEQGKHRIEEIIDSQCVKSVET